jgi:SAM-dependent methyltransferase
MNNVPDYDRVWTEVYGDLQNQGPVHRHLRFLVKKLLSQIQYDSVLDVGCGPGQNIPLLCEGRQVQRFDGADISPWALEQARQVGTGEFHRLDIQTAKLEGCWDLVFCSLLLEHLPDDVAALSNLRAMTGQFLLLTTIAGDYKRYRAWEEQVGHVRNYRVGELEDKLATAGFSLEKVIYWGYPFYSPLVRVLHNHFKAKSNFSRMTTLVADAMYYLYFLNSHQRGDVLIILAKV